MLKIHEFGAKDFSQIKLLTACNYINNKIFIRILEFHFILSLNSLLESFIKRNSSKILELLVSTAS